MARDAGSAVAAAEVREIVVFFRRVFAQGHVNVIAVIAQFPKLCVPLDRNAGGFQTRDQQLLVVVLRETEDERVQAEAFAEVVDADLRSGLPVCPNQDVFDGNAFPHDFVGEPEPAVELQRAGLHDHRPGRQAGAGLLIDDARHNTGLGER